MSGPGVGKSSAHKRSQVTENLLIKIKTNQNISNRLYLNVIFSPSFLSLSLLLMSLRQLTFHFFDFGDTSFHSQCQSRAVFSPHCCHVFVQDSTEQCPVCGECYHWVPLQAWSRCQLSWLAQASGDSVGDIIAMLHLNRALALAESLAHYSSCIYIIHHM